MKAKGEHLPNGCGSEAGKDERKQYRKAKYAEPEEAHEKLGVTEGEKAKGTKETEEAPGSRCEENREESRKEEQEAE